LIFGVFQKEENGVDSMEGEKPLSGVAINIMRECLIVTIQTELYDEAVFQMQKEILEMVNKRDFNRLIIDLSQVEVLDSFLTQAIFDTAKMAALMGVKTVFTGLRPEVSASIIDLDINIKGIETTLTIEEAFQRLAAPS
jgi:rsbT antagonist protein RsbS